MKLKNNSNLDGWSISSELFEWIRDNIPDKSTILEFCLNIIKEKEDYIIVE
jgi:hypothetical protein